jgi:hypothetical protein
MRSRSELRLRRLHAYRVSQRAQADYYEDVFDRWVRLYGPPVTFPPKYSSFGVKWSSEPAARLAATLSSDLKSVSDRIANVIPHDTTRRAFFNRIEGAAIYVRGERYMIQPEKKKRIQEILFCYAVLGGASAIGEMEQGIAKISERTQGHAAQA